MLRGFLAASIASALFTGSALAQQAPEPPRPRTWVLVSAVGTHLSHVRLRQQAGSNLEPYRRRDVEVPGIALDASVLKGLERVVRQREPDANVVFMKLNPGELAGVAAYQRGDVAIGKLAAAFDAMPGREQWHRIVVVTPGFLRSEYRGMGAKLGGIGYYVQPFDTMRFMPGYSDMAEWETVTPDGKPSRAHNYIAPFFYAQVYVLDPATLEVLELSESYDFVKFNDPEATAIDIEQAIPAAKLVPAMQSFLERASARALREAIGVVTVSDPKVVPDPVPAPAPAKP